MSIGKTKRFEIFKRDSFTCRYCGRRPPEVVLEVDHIEPVAKGGTDEDLNLITSCFDCNRGKRDRRLSDAHPRPDADLAYLEVQQEVAEAKRYLQASKIREELQHAVVDRLEEVWTRSFRWARSPAQEQWLFWAKQFSAEEIEYAIQRSVAFQKKNSARTPQLVKYISGILWKRKAEADGNN